MVSKIAPFSTVLELWVTLYVRDQIQVTAVPAA
jgi:hypothetical protein